MTEQRQLVAIMFTDIVGYSALMARDEQLALACLQRQRALFARLLPAHRGTLHKEMGDGTLCTFASARDAVGCALALQAELGDDGDAPFRVRIGVHVGEVLFSAGDVHGDGVNVAARLEPLAGPGEVLVSDSCHDALRNHVAWHFEPLGPKQLKNIARAVTVYRVAARPAHAPASPATTRPARKTALRRRWLIGGVVLAAGLALAAADLLPLLRHADPAPAAAPPPATAPASIAVLPFRDISAEGGNEYFAEGIAEELLNLLARIPELRVAARSSAFALRGADATPQAVARQLHVTHVLEGSVRKAGERVRVSVRLVQADTGFQLWSESYDRRLENIFAIQDEIGAAVIGQLRVRLLGAAPRATKVSPEAFNLFLQAQYLTARSSPQGFEQALALYRQALAIDPGYAAAWEGTARVYQFQSSLGLRDADEGYALAREAATKALAIDPDFALAHARLGAIALFHDGDIATAAQHMRRGYALSPRDARVIGNLALLTRAIGRVDATLRFATLAYAVDPLNPRGNYQSGYNFLAAGRLEDSISRLREALLLSPGFASANYALAIALERKGDHAAALQAAQAETATLPRLAALAVVEHASGNDAAATTARAALQAATARDGAGAYLLAGVLARHGDTDAAFAALDSAIAHRAHNPEWTQLLVDPLLQPLHADPRWATLLDRIGMAPATLAGIDLPEPG